MIIAIDGASTDLSVALAEPDGSPIDGLSWTSAQRQSAELMPRLLQLAERNGRRLDETTAIGVGTGPGSFTGLRVAMALAKGLAFALVIPIVGAPSLVAWLDADPAATLALARAGAREAYALARGRADPAIIDRDALPDRVRAATLVAPAELAEAFGLRAARAPNGAPAIARATADRLSRDAAGDDLGRLEPIYLRAPRGITTEAQGAVTWL
jgi:tRNA threonylcarbamoyladenosine biosynthesis protein TsaB